LLLSNSQLSRFRWLSIGLGFFLTAAGGLLAQASKKAPEPTRTAGVPASYRGGLVTPPLPKPKFTLTDTAGAPYDLTSKTQGHVTLLFFGYTYCPDMCPAQMAIIAQALGKMPAASVDQLKVVFVTTDPARDTPARLRLWLDHFDKHFIGLTGTEAAIRTAQLASNVPPATKSAVRSDGSYDVGHAAFVLAYTKDNFAHVIYPVGMKLEDWEHDLPLLVTEDWTKH
jgi:protein SCO1/2